MLGGRRVEDEVWVGGWVGGREQILFGCLERGVAGDGGGRGLVGAFWQH